MGNHVVHFQTLILKEKIFKENSKIQKFHMQSTNSSKRVKIF